MVKVKWFIVLFLFLIAVPPCIADVYGPIEGTWRIVSFEREYQDTGECECPRGKAPTGYILFLHDGRMAVVITDEGRKAPTTDQDRAGLFNSLVAYTGLYYYVDSNVWITEVDVSANPVLVGTQQMHYFQITNERLREITEWAVGPEKRIARTVITYKRVK
jgi:hypothetical protein